MTVVLAHQPILSVLPFVVPALLSAVLLGAVVWRDRRSEQPPDL